MLKLKDLEKIDDGDSWKKLVKDVEAMIDNGPQKLNKLTEIVLEGFINRLKRETLQKKDLEIGIQNSVGDEKEEHLMNRKQKKRKTISANDKKQKRQKTGNEKKQNRQNRHDSVVAELTALGLEPPPDMPEAFKNCIVTLGGTEITLVVQKFVEVTDLKKSPNRLAITIKQLKNEFLSEVEEEKLKNKQGMEVKFIEPCLRVSKMHLTQWKLGANPAYVLNTHWNDVVTNNANSLKPKAVVQIWSFRIEPESKLGFAMVKVRDGEDGHVI